MSAISFQQRPFGILETGQAVTCYSLRNTSGMAVNLLNYGAILNAIQIPDLRGEMHQMTLGPSQVEDLKHVFPSGSTVIHLPARYGIAFHSLNQTPWAAENITYDQVEDIGQAASVKLSLQGQLDLKYSRSRLEYACTNEYILTSTDELIIRSQIQTSLPLPVFMSHHLIWNLTAGETKNVSDHVLQVFSSYYSELDQAGFAKSDFTEISNESPFNFKQPQRIGEKYAQIAKEKTYDTCFKLTEAKETPNTANLPLAACVKAPVSGRILELRTTQPGLRFSLKTNEANALEGFCLSPMPLLHSTASQSDTLQQETRYKLIW